VSDTLNRPVRHAVKTREGERRTLWWYRNKASIDLYGSHDMGRYLGRIPDWKLAHTLTTMGWTCTKKEATHE